MTGPFATLQDAVDADAFPDVDLALRRGRHVDRDDSDWYAFLVDAQPWLEAFYHRFGCELIHRADGYFYLLPTGDRLGRRHLSSGEMLVGQALTLLYLDPATVEHGGVLTREQVLAQLAGVMGAEALRRRATLGFVEVVDEARVRLRPALMRFAEPARETGAPEKTLERLVAAGELVLTETDDGPPDDAEDPEARE